MWTLTRHISTHLKRKRLGDLRLPSLWPSDASIILTNDYGEDYVVGSCRRATYFRYTFGKYLYDPNITRDQELVEQLLGLEEEPDVYMRWIWEAGNLFESYIIEMAKQSGVYQAEQIQLIIPEYNIVGKLDLIVRDPDTNDLIAQEVKSIYGHNANAIIGTPSMGRKGLLGKPRESNMMQLAIYDWHLKSRMQGLTSSRLLYGARDTGRYAEFELKTYEEDGVTKIKYRGVSPYLTAPVVSPITIDGILANYEYISNAFEAGDIPPRDYTWSYPRERIHTLYERRELTKTNTEAYEKILNREKENKERLSTGLKPKKELKPIEVGDWMCSSCAWRRFCYDKNKVPRND